MFIVSIKKYFYGSVKRGWTGTVKRYYLWKIPIFTKIEDNRERFVDLDSTDINTPLIVNREETWLQSLPDQVCDSEAEKKEWRYSDDLRP